MGRGDLAHIPNFVDATTAAYPDQDQFGALCQQLQMSLTQLRCQAVATSLTQMLAPAQGQPVVPITSIQPESLMHIGLPSVPFDQNALLQQQSRQVQGQMQPQMSTQQVPPWCVL